LDADLLATQNIEIVPENEQLIWELRDWIVLFKNSIKRLSKRQASSPSNAIEFDKDDEDTLDLVASTANIRAHIFAIPKASKFDIKAMAGNIIPAIATTNAIAAAMIVGIFLLGMRQIFAMLTSTMVHSEMPLLWKLHVDRLRIALSVQMTVF
jgi:hypothetical protein